MDGLGFHERPNVCKIGATRPKLP